ncbi:YbgA family protein [Rheinheimera sp.]|uniref:YbgA family protein n=1 Tax=Rheinheimera sp. TaxID=1869214 RepID=UPI003AF71C3E
MRIQVGISACVLGQKVRFNGGHKALPFATEQLSRFVDFVPYCPELAMGLGTPRDTIRLQQDNQQQIRLVNSTDATIDHTDAMRAGTAQVLPAMAALSGYIVCAKSPSCGMERVKVTDPHGFPVGKLGVGVFTQQLMQQYPWLPVEEDGRLHDANLRENFVTRVWACYQYQQLLQSGFTVGKLVAFHSRYKFLVMAHSPVAYRELGRLVAQAKLFSPDELALRYLTDLMQALKQTASRKQQANVLQHLLGFFKHSLAASAKQELLRLIEHYRLGHLPLLAPLTLLKHHLSQQPHAYLQAQVYFQPFPDELGLRA